MCYILTSSLNHLQCGFATSGELQEVERFFISHALHPLYLFCGLPTSLSNS